MGELEKEVVSIKEFEENMRRQALVLKGKWSVSSEFESDDNRNWVAKPDGSDLGGFREETSGPVNMAQRVG